MTDTPQSAVPRPLSAFGLSIVIAVLLLDQASKFAAERWLEAGRFIDVLPILALFRVHNTGVAFSFGNDLGSLVLVLGTALITVFVLYLWHSAKDGGRLVGAGFALITGGALGNLVDRVRLGHVIDFLYLHIGERGFFVFNLADTALTIGPVLLAWYYLLGNRRR